LLHSILLVFDSARVESDLAQCRRSALPCGEQDVRAPADVLGGIDAGESRLGPVNNFPGTPAVL
jgi:hypothetical protein